MTALLVVIVLAVLLLLLASGVPIAFSLLISGGVGLYLGDGLSVTEATLSRVPYSATASYTLVVIPMFMLMGALANHGGIARRAFDGLAIAARRIPGGLGFATLGASTAFAAVSGSSLATIVTIGRTSVEEMTRKGYDRTFAAGIVGVAGTLGILIPPSIALVLFGVLTGVSIGDLLVAGIVPGLLSATMYGAAIVWRIRRRPQDVGRTTTTHKARESQMVGSGSGTMPTHVGRQEADADINPEPDRLRIGGLVRIAILFVIVVGGIYSGVVTVMEAAALGALATLLITVVDNIREPSVLWRRLWSAVQETAGTTGMLMALLLGAAVFTRFTVSAGIPQSFTSFAGSLDWPPLLIVLMIFAVLIPLGMFLDGLSILLVVVPITWPVVEALGYDGLWYGILFIKFIEIGMITPPVGLNAFALSGTVKDLDIESAFKGMLYFLPFEFITIAILIAFPSVITWLPSLGT